MNLSRMLILFIVFLVVGIGGASAGQYSYVVPPKELWTCFDYAMHYSQDNPEWGMVLISSHSRFRGIGNSHFVNYQIQDNEDLLIFDVFKKNKYTMKGEWYYEPVAYYHFYIDEKPTRYFKYKLPNTEVIYDAL